MTDQYTKLRDALNAGLTQGPWTHDSGIVPPDGPGRYSTISAEDDDLSIAEVNDLIPEGAANAAYIAAASPTTVTTLLAERDALRRALEWTAAALQSACTMPEPIREAGDITIAGETRTIKQILDAADAALTQEGL